MKNILVDRRRQDRLGGGRPAGRTRDYAAAAYRVTVADRSAALLAAIDARPIARLHTLRSTSPTPPRCAPRWTGASPCSAPRPST